MFGKKKLPLAPPRQPHPDPRVEVQLQQILALRESIERRVTLITQYTEDITRVTTLYHYSASNGYFNEADYLKAQLKELQEEVRHVEK